MGCRSAGHLFHRKDDDIVRYQWKHWRHLANVVTQQINSIYGATGSPYFRYYLPQIAGGTTLTGQLTIRWAEKTINEKMNKILSTDGKDYTAYGDTDSVFIILDDLIDLVKPDNPIDFIDKIMKDVFEPLFETSYDELAERMGAMSNRMVLEREKIATGIFQEPKRYILNIYDNEGVRYEKPKLKVTGIEAVRASIPAVFRSGLKECFSLILETNDESIVFDRINELKEEYRSMDLRKISSPMTANNLEKFSDPILLYKKGTPINVRAALLYNQLIKKKDLENRYRMIGSGDKILFVHLITPNPIHENVIGFLDFFPDEFGLNDYIDRETQIQKLFVAPLERMFATIGWSSLKEAKGGNDCLLDSFF